MEREPDHHTVEIKVKFEFRGMLWSTLAASTIMLAMANCSELLSWLMR
jgi:hypothetical protein